MWVIDRPIDRLDRDGVLMKLGLYFDARNPPQCERDPRSFHQWILELCERADQAGISSLWFSEHHGFRDGYLPQPLVLAAAAAARTTHVRLGTSILILPLHHSVEVTEQAALVDCISGGRLELGVGAGYSVPDFEIYGVPRRGRTNVMFDRITQIRDLWESGTATPRPVQSNVPIWVGASSDEVVRRVGATGAGLLRIGRDLLPAYLNGIAQSGRSPIEARLAGPVNVLLSEDPERDWPRIRSHVNYQWSHYAELGATVVSGEAFDVEAFRARGLSNGSMRGFLVATPEDAAGAIRELTDGTPAETCYVWATLPGLPEDLALSNIELAATRLAPLPRDI